MKPKEYSIVDDKGKGEKEDSEIYNIKLTEELVEKMIKGQRDLNNLNGIEFIISESDKGTDVNLNY